MLGATDEEAKEKCMECFENLYNIDNQEQVAIHMCGFDMVRRGNYFEGKPSERIEFELRVGKLKNMKVAGKDEITKEMKKDGGDGLVDWIWRVCNTVFDWVKT